MERLHLLKPDVVSGYLNEGKGQEVTYLHINDVIDVEELMDDVRLEGENMEVKSILNRDNIVSWLKTSNPCVL